MVSGCRGAGGYGRRRARDGLPGLGRRNSSIEREADGKLCGEGVVTDGVQTGFSGPRTASCIEDMHTGMWLTLELGAQETNQITFMCFCILARGQAGECSVGSRRQQGASSDARTLTPPKASFGISNRSITAYK
eukprot:IDg11507t1